MERYVGGSNVEGGYYWNLQKWSVAAVLGDRGELEGTAEERYLRVPLVVLAPLSLFMGGLFVIFLPLVGFVVAIYALAKKVASLVSPVVRDAVATPTWRPGEAHFTGKDEEPASPSAGPIDSGRLQILRSLVDAKRQALEAAKREEEKREEKQRGEEH